MSKELEMIEKIIEKQLREDSTQSQTYDLILDECDKMNCGCDFANSVIEIMERHNIFDNETLDTALDGLDIYRKIFLMLNSFCIKRVCEKIKNNISRFTMNDDFFYSGFYSFLEDIENGGLFDESKN